MNFILYFLIALGVFAGLSEHPSTTNKPPHVKVLISASWPFVLTTMITINEISQLEANQQIMKKDK